MLFCLMFSYVVETLDRSFCKMIYNLMCGCAMRSLKAGTDMFILIDFLCT
jgi:hypothetical protein